MFGDSYTHVVCVLGLVALVLAGCGGDDGEGISSAENEANMFSIAHDDQTIDADEYARIETGMTAEEVRTLTDSPTGETVSESDLGGIHTVLVRLDGYGSVGANALLTFQDGSLVAKAQSGLEPPPPGAREL